MQIVTLSNSLSNLRVSDKYLIKSPLMHYTPLSLVWLPIVNPRLFPCFLFLSRLEFQVLISKAHIQPHHSNNLCQVQKGTLLVRL